MSTTNILDMNNRIEELEKNSGGGGSADSAKRSDIATEFSTETSYTAGNFVYYEGKLYQFNADHTAGAWDSTDVVEANVTNQIVSNASAIAGLTASDVAYDNTDSGLTATDVQGAVDELRQASNIMMSDGVTSVEDRLDANDFPASFIDITSQTTGAYTALSDGYLYLDAHDTTTTIITANVYGSVSSNNIRLTASFINGNTYNSLFIRKGMRVNIATNNDSGKAYFVALQ